MLVLVHLLLVSMVLVVEHSHHDDDVEMEGVASSAQRASRLPAPGATVPVEQPLMAAAHVARQRESGRPSKAPSQAASSGALAAARELLRNPPAAAASPDALRQWWDDVDRLLYLAQASPQFCKDWATTSAWQCGGTLPPAPGRCVGFRALPYGEGCANRRPAGGAQPQARG